MVGYTLFSLIIISAFVVFPGYALANSSTVSTHIEVYNNGAGSTNDISVHTDTGGNYINGTEVPQKSNTHIEVNGKSYDYKDAENVSVVDYNGETKITVDGKSDVIATKSPEAAEQISKAQEKVSEAQRRIEDRKKDIEKKVVEQNNVVQKLLERLRELFKNFF